MNSLDKAQTIQALTELLEVVYNVLQIEKENLGQLYNIREATESKLVDLVQSIQSI
jgi:hypothetical protein